MFTFEHTHQTIDLNIQAMMDYLLYSSLFLSIAAVSKAYVSSILQAMPVSLGACLIMFLVTFSVYNMNRKTDRSEDAINHSRRFAFTQKYAGVLWYSSLAGYAVAFLVAGYYGPWALLATAVPLASGILYSIPFMPKGCRDRRLKDVPLVKNLLIGLAWAVPVACLPAACTGAPFGMMTVVVGLFFFLLSFINSTVFDIRDVAGDAGTGVKTIPVMLGIRKTKILLSFLNLAGIAVVLWLCRGALPFLETLVIAALALYVQGYIVFFDGSELNRILYDLVADGQNLLLGGMMCLAVICVV